MRFVADIIRGENVDKALISLNILKKMLLTN
jgi:ribosomal protein L22